jgi:hypothetical protein
MASPLRGFHAGKEARIAKIAFVALEMPCDRLDFSNRAGWARAIHGAAPRIVPYHRGIDRAVVVTVVNAKGHPFISGRTTLRGFAHFERELAERFVRNV